MRGLEKPKDTGFTKLLNSVWTCTKSQTRSVFEYQKILVIIEKYYRFKIMKQIRKKTLSNILYQMSYAFIYKIKFLLL